MKTFAFMLLILSTSVLAAPTCEGTATKAVLKKVTAFNPNWGVEYVSCELAPNGKVNLCEVAGSNGDGAGDKSFLVVVSKNCAKAFEVRLTGEE